MKIGEGIVVKPTWEPYEPSSGEIIIDIDPGMAFGTGTHATTKLCLESISSIFKRKAPYAAANQPVRVLDVGTGSGILAIAAVKLGAYEVVGVDIDPEAVVVALENASLNRVETNLHLSTTPLGQISGTFDIVVANILAEELVRLAPQLVAKVSPGGCLLLSGILLERESLVLDGFASSGLQLLATAHEGDWSCISYIRSL
jgi:ribosomal protein L11 methyltransferase